MPDLPRFLDAQRRVLAGRLGLSVDVGVEREEVVDPAGGPGGRVRRELGDQRWSETPYLVTVTRVEREPEEVSGRDRQRFLVADLGGHGGEPTVPARRAGTVVEIRDRSQQGDLLGAGDRESVKQAIGELLGLPAKRPGDPHRSQPERQRDRRCLIAGFDRVLQRGAQVGVIGQQRGGQLTGRAAAIERLTRRGDVCRKVPPVAEPLRRRRLADAQLVQRKRTDQLQQLVAAVAALAADETGLEQLVDFRAGRAVRDRLERRRREATEEYGRAAQHPLRGGGEQVVAPGDRRLERLLAGGEIPDRVLADRERRRDLLGDLPGTERPRARGGELDRQRKSIERTTDLRDRPRDRQVDLELAV